MALSARSFAWPGRLVDGVRGHTTFVATRRAVADAIGSVRILSGYSLVTGLGLFLGLARELTVASTFGLSPQLDVFVAVMTVQAFFGAQIGNALETAFIGRVASQRTPHAVCRSLRPALSGVLLVNGGVVLGLSLSGGLLLEDLFPLFDGGQLMLATQMLQALLLPMVCASTAGLLRGSLAVLGSFAPGFLAGSIVSMCMIVSIAVFSSSLGIDALTLGVAIGNLGVLGLFVVRLVVLRREAVPESCETTSVMKRDGWFVLWRAATTVLVAELLYAGVAITERSLASWLPAGSIAAFFYAGTIVSVPLSLFMVPLTTMAFPAMAEAFGRDLRAGVAQLRKHGMLLLMVSVAVLLVVIPVAQPLIETVFMRGQFSAEHARLTASILSVTILALPFMSLSRLIRNACYALSDYRIPVIGLLIQCAALAGLGLLLVPRYGARGLAVAMVAGEAAILLSMTLILIRRLRGQ